METKTVKTEKTVADNALERLRVSEIKTYSQHIETVIDGAAIEYISPMPGKVFVDKFVLQDIESNDQFELKVKDGLLVIEIIKRGRCE